MFDPWLPPFEETLTDPELTHKTGHGEDIRFSEAAPMCGGLGEGRLSPHRVWENVPLRIGAAVCGSESLLYEDVTVDATLGDKLSKPIGGACMLDGLFVIADAANDSPATRWIVLAACVAFGGYLIFVGMSNIRSRYAEEGGKRRTSGSSLTTMAS